MFECRMLEWSGTYGLSFMGKTIGERGKQANLEPSAIIANERKGQSLYIKMYLFFFLNSFSVWCV